MPQNTPESTPQSSEASSPRFPSAPPPSPVDSALETNAAPPKMPPRQRMPVLAGQPEGASNMGMTGVPTEFNPNVQYAHVRVLETPGGGFKIVGQREVSGAELAASGVKAYDCKTVDFISPDAPNSCENIGGSHKAETAPSPSSARLSMPISSRKERREELKKQKKEVKKTMHQVKVKEKEVDERKKELMKSLETENAAGPQSQQILKSKGPKSEKGKEPLNANRKEAHATKCEAVKAMKSEAPVAAKGKGPVTGKMKGPAIGKGKGAAARNDKVTNPERVAESCRRVPIAAYESESASLRSKAPETTSRKSVKRKKGRAAKAIADKETDENAPDLSCRLGESNVQGGIVNYHKCISTPAAHSRVHHEPQRAANLPRIPKDPQVFFGVDTSTAARAVLNSIMTDLAEYREVCMAGSNIHTCEPPPGLKPPPGLLPPPELELPHQKQHASLSPEQTNPTAVPSSERSNPQQMTARIRQFCDQMEEENIPDLMLLQVGGDIPPRMRMSRPRLEELARSWRCCLALTCKCGSIVCLIGMDAII